jgi:hypothetical protein
MNRNTLSRETLRLLIQIFLLLLAYSLVRRTGLHQFTGHETEGLNTLIVVVGSIYAVILAFAIFVIWGQFTDVENCVMRECNTLADLVRFGAYVPAEFSRSIHRAVADYAQHVLKHEWRALSEARRDKRADEIFSELMTVVIAGAQSASLPEAVHWRLIDVARKAGERRGERVTKSLTRIPPTMFWFVNTIAGALLLLVFAYPFHQLGAGMACVALVGVVLFLANLVMRDMDNPLEGIWNVNPRPFAELRM